MPKTKKITKKDLEKQIKQARFLSKPAKEDWIYLLQDSDDSDLEELYDNFSKAKSAENDFMLKLIYKAGLGGDLVKEMEKNIQKVKRMLLKKGKA